MESFKDTLTRVQIHSRKAALITKTVAKNPPKLRITNNNTYDTDNMVEG